MIRARCAVWSVGFLLLGIPGWGGEETASFDETARWLAAHTRIKKGIGLDVGCGEGRLAAALGRCTGMLMYGVESDAQRVALGQAAIDAAGQYGSHALVEKGSFDPLPYPSNSAAWVICGDGFHEGLRGRSLKEIYRVLSPNGVALLGRRAGAGGVDLNAKTLRAWLDQADIAGYEILEEHGVWARIVKPMQPGWDEWSHRAHDPAQTLASRDDLPGSKGFKAQWFGPFRPGTASGAVAVSGGRWVVASLAYQNAPEYTPFVQVIDAFTGIEQWSRVGAKACPLDRTPGLYSNRETCSDLAVADGTIYLLAGARCVLMDLETGADRAAFSIPAEAGAAQEDKWLYLSRSGDLLYGATGLSPQMEVDWSSMHDRGQSRALFALDPKTGATRWCRKLAISAGSIVLDERCIYGCQVEEDTNRPLRLLALDKTSGEERWRGPDLAYAEGTEVLSCSLYSEKIWMLRSPPQLGRNGEALRGWELHQKALHHRLVDAYAVEDGKLAFACDFETPISALTFSGEYVIGMPQHGKGMGILKTSDGTQVLSNSGFGAKCAVSLATPNTLLVRQGSTAIYDLASWATNPSAKLPRPVILSGFRPNCSYPAMPAYGMLHIQASGCACASPLRGNLAMTPGAIAWEESPQEVEKGPAFNRYVEPAQENIWQGWRGDKARSGRIQETLALPLTPLGEGKVWGQPTPMAAGHGLVFIGTSHRKMYALDASTGALRWSRIVEGRIEVTPHLEGGRLYFGDDAGWVYCLAAQDGELVWRYRAALGYERMIRNGNYASRWPVGGGVMTHNGMAYFASGLLTEEKTALLGIDLTSGALRFEKRFEGRGFTGGFVARGAMAISGERLYLTTGVGTPWSVDLQNPESAPTPVPGRHVKGEDMMVLNHQAYVETPSLNYVYHVHFKPNAPERQRLPIVTEDSIVRLNYELPGGDRETRHPGAYLVAMKKDCFELKNGRLNLQRSYERGSPDEFVRWRAWKGERMTTLLEANGTLISGGDKKVFATELASGRELWNAPVPGVVADLAIQQGRLIVLTWDGAIVCFGPLQKSKP